MSGFVFDARAALAAIAGRTAERAKSAVAAVPAVFGPRRLHQPHEPQQPQPSAMLTDEADAIEERAALAADRVPAVYLDAWARLQCQRPSCAAETAWRRAINDAGLFLDAWGAIAAAMCWGESELFEAPRDGHSGGLIWAIDGKRVEALGDDHARLANGRLIERGSLWEGGGGR